MAESEEKQEIQSQAPENADTNNNDKIYLSHPLPLDDRIFEQAVKQDLELNYQEYLQQLAEEEKINPVTEKERLLDTGYREKIENLQEQSILAALNERPGEAYDLLQQVCYFSEQDLQYIRAVEGENADSLMYTYVKKRLENVSELQPVINFVDAVNEAEVYLISDMPNFNSYKADVLVEKMENSGDKLLDSEGLCMIDFISSKLHRKVSAQNIYQQDKSPSKSEMEYLQRVLSKSSDFRLISYCQTRLPANENPKPVIRAYQRALSKTKDRKNAYKINMALADLYFVRGQIIGFTTPNSDKVKFTEKGLHYLTGAYRYAARDNRLDVLKKMADAHLKLNRSEEWKNIKEVIAMKFLTKEDRCEALMAIGDKAKDPTFYYKAVEQCNKARMPRASKLSILDKAYGKIALSLPEGEERTEVLKQQEQVRSEKQNASFLQIFGQKTK